MRKVILLAALAWFSTSALAQVARPMPSPAEMAAMAAERAAYDAMPLGTGTGPYPAVMELDPALANHVVYRPVDVRAMGKKKLGVMVWGNGGCMEDGASARQHLIEIASHGYLVIAPGAILSGPRATGKVQMRAMTGDGKFPPIATTPAEVRAGIDWALAENKRSGSAYRGRIDPAAIAVSGHSCGGLQALSIAGDQRVKTVVIHNSGIFADGISPITGMTITKAALAGLHTPVVYFLGGPTDIAYPNGTDDYARISHVPVTMVNMPVGHGGTFSRVNGGTVAAAAVDWLEWQLRGDRVAARTFVGENCRLCAVKDWKVDRKGW